MKHNASVARIVGRAIRNHLGLSTILLKILHAQQQKAAYFSFIFLYQSSYNDRSENKVLYNKSTKREEHKTKTKLLKLEVKISKLPIKRLVQK